MPLILLLATGDIVTQVFHLGRENVRGVGGSGQCIGLTTVIAVF